MKPTARSALKRIALDDVSIVVPVRIDTPDRLRNLGLALAWLDSAFEGQETLVLEHGAVASAADTVRAHSADHVFVGAAACFHKSRVFNLGLALAARPFALLYDCDVLVPAQAIDDAIEMLRRDIADYVYPYNGVMLEVACDESDPSALLERARTWSDVSCTGATPDGLPVGATYLNGTIAEPSTGGALAVKRRTLLLHGGFNPNIASYGCEDTELETRVRKLGARVSRLPRYNCFHVRHRRGADSRYNALHAANLAEWKKVEAMSASEVGRYVGNGFRTLALDASTRIEVVDTPERFSVTVLPAPAHEASDVAFVMLIPGEPALPPALVTAFVDRVEQALGGYEVYLLERDGYRYRAVSHRDHVVYASIASESDHELLSRHAREVERERLCICSVFLDASDAAFTDALGAVGSGAAQATRMAPSEAPADADPRARRMLELLRTRLGRDAQSFLFDRRALLAWLESSRGTFAARSWSEIADAAYAALGRRDQ